MLFGLCLGYDTAIVGPQASQACWCMLDDAVRPANTCEAVRSRWMRGGVKYTLSIRAGRSRPVTGFPRRAPRRVWCSGTKKSCRALLASGLQYASLSGAAPILLEPRGRTNSASNSHSSTSLQGNDEFAVETSIVHNAAAAATIG